MKLLISFLLLSIGAAAQTSIDVTNNDVNINSNFFHVVSGAPIAPATFYRVVDGSVFFKDGWMKGAVSFDKQTEYRNLQLKLDLLEGKLHFRDIKGEEMVCVTPVALVKLVDPASGVTHQFIHTSFIPAFSRFKPASWVEVLADGKAQLYLHRKKNVKDDRPYGSATLERRIYTADFYYLVVDDRMVRIKKVQDIIDALPDKKGELTQWVKDNSLEKNHLGFIKLIGHYNSLVK